MAGETAYESILYTIARHQADYLYVKYYIASRVLNHREDSKSVKRYVELKSIAYSVIC